MHHLQEGVHFFINTKYSDKKHVIKNDLGEEGRGPLDLPLLLDEDLISILLN